MARIEREPAHFAFADTEVRRALLRRFPYAVYFIVDDASVIVLACLHVRRDPSVWESRR